MEISIVVSGMVRLEAQGCTQLIIYIHTVDSRTYHFLLS